MKYIKDFDSIIESKSTENLDEAVNASGYLKAGKLGINDQFLGRRSLSWTLSVDLGLKATDEYVGPWIGFDHVSMYAVGRKGGTILDDALTNKYTYEELKAAAAKYLGIEESAEVNEAKFVSSYDTKVDNAETEREVLKIYPKAKFFTGKLTHFFGELEPNLFFKAYYPKYYKEDTGKTVKGDFKITSVYSQKGRNYVELMKESLNEAKKFKPGDKWSSDFDYDGMLKYALKVNEKTPIKMLNKLFDSATDVNYHTPFANLGIAIDWIEDGDTKGAKDYIKNFHEDIKKEMKNQGIK